MITVHLIIWNPRAEIGDDRGEGVVGNPRFCTCDRGEEGRLSGIGHTHESNIGHDFERESHTTSLPTLWTTTGRTLLLSLQRGGTFPALPTFRQDECGIFVRDGTDLPEIKGLVVVTLLLHFLLLFLLLLLRNTRQAFVSSSISIPSRIIQFDGLFLFSFLFHQFYCDHRPGWYQDFAVLAATAIVVHSPTGTTILGTETEQPFTDDKIIAIDDAVVAAAVVDIVTTATTTLLVLVTQALARGSGTTSTKGVRTEGTTIQSG
mmetsp:Transcript_17866/g.18049  ORF Transcript_17866/g.18049 Transcript_17866/m.18049 type:complete len:262 (-) Transcript_17866:61-846(-)